MNSIRLFKERKKEMKKIKSFKELSSFGSPIGKREDVDLSAEILRMLGEILESLKERKQKKLLYYGVYAVFQDSDELTGRHKAEIREGLSEEEENITKCFTKELLKKS